MLPIRSPLSRSLIAASRPSQATALRFCSCAARRQLSVYRPLVRANIVPVGRNISKPLGIRTYSNKNEEVVEPLKVVTFEEIKKLSDNPDPKRVIVDVREPHELERSGIIPNSINVPFSTAPDAWFLSPDSFEDRFGFDKPSEDTELVFSCKAGIRSNAAARIAMSAGYGNVASYEGSWMDWAKNTGAPTY
ncbi:hypothetical protein TWF730_011055 [Orbilia blumenaviensis]|uniref:Rhodanese domain-containing protein n=1 Tax=Orbilia blumenaviensis TaxID=1796055 RepID=A0AAV9UJA2_9PEZI